MYLLELYYANARLNQNGKFIFLGPKGTIPKWTNLSSHPREKEKLQLMALSMAGTRYLPHIPQPSKRKPVRIRPGTILLIDVDGGLPNLALMKLSRYFKEQGRRVILRYKDCWLKGPEAVYASAVFHNHVTDKRISNLRRYYGESLMLGGSGVNINRRLPENIEKLPPDCDLYPEFSDRAIGFLTRGCPFRCAFCIVPAKEGRPRQVSDLDTLLAGRRKLILQDDKVRVPPESIIKCLNRFAQKGLKYFDHPERKPTLREAHVEQMLAFVEVPPDPGSKQWRLLKVRYIGHDFTAGHISKIRKLIESHLKLVVNNARFLIMPWIYSPNLVSRILGGIAKQLPLDWEARYNYQPVLLETFAQLDRFKGTCYQAANWIEVGKTEGYSLFSSYKRYAIAKAIYVYPLRKSFRRHLCSL